MIKHFWIVLFCLVATVFCRNYPLMKQCDPRWANVELGTSGTTICRIGCLITAVAMALDGCGWSYDPSTFNTWLNANGGYYNGGEYIWSTPNRIGFVFQGKVSNLYIPYNLNKRNAVLCNVRGGTHWVLAYAYDGSTIYVNDAGFDRISYDLS